MTSPEPHSSRPTLSRARFPTALAKSLQWRELTSGSSLRESLAGQGFSQYVRGMFTAEVIGLRIARFQIMFEVS